MGRTAAERQRRYRERRWQDRIALLDKLTVLEARGHSWRQACGKLVARPRPARRRPSRRQDAALKRERDELAERLQRLRLTSRGLRRRRRLMGYPSGADEAHRAIDPNFRIAAYPDIH